MAKTSEQVAAAPLVGGQETTLHTQTFSSLTGKPTTLGGYNITDALAASAFSGLAKITVGITAPTSPSAGDLWVDTS